MANFAYTADQGGIYADDLVKLQAYIDHPELFISPRSTRGQTLPANFDDLPAAQQAKALRQASSFVLLPLGNPDQLQNPSSIIMLFERPDDTDDVIGLSRETGEILWTFYTIPGPDDPGAETWDWEADFPPAGAATW